MIKKLKFWIKYLRNRLLKQKNSLLLNCQDKTELLLQHN